MNKILEKPSRVINGEKMYGVKKLSRILQTDEGTIRKFFREQKFPKVKINRQYYLSEKDLLSFLSSGAVIKPIPFSEFMTYKEIKQFDTNILRATKKKLKMIGEVIERNRIKVKMIDNPEAKIALENYIRKYEAIEKFLKEAEEQPISPDDFY
ncbi:hypothetical protein ES705_29291 [subsurface metagenome]